MSDTTKCFNCGTPTAMPQKVKLDGSEILFCLACFACAKSAAPRHISLLQEDKQYLQLRDHRNRQLNVVMEGGFPAPTKHLDASLELYERKMGTDYCAVLYHNHLHR